MKNTRATNDWMIEWMALKMRFLCKVSKKPNFRSLILNNNSLLTSFHAGTSRSFQTGCFITLTWGVRFSFHTGTIFDQKIRYVCVYCAWIIGIRNSRRSNRHWLTFHILPNGNGNGFPFRFMRLLFYRFDFFNPFFFPFHFLLPMAFRWFWMMMFMMLFMMFIILLRRVIIAASAAAPTTSWVRITTATTASI